MDEVVLDPPVERPAWLERILNEEQKRRTRNYYHRARRDAARPGEVKVKFDPLPIFSPKKKFLDEMKEPRPKRYEPVVFEPDELKPLAVAVLKSAIADLNDPNTSLHSVAAQFLLTDFWDDDCLWLNILGPLPQAMMLKEIRERIASGHRDKPRKSTEDALDEQQGVGEEILE